VKNGKNFAAERTRKGKKKRKKGKARRNDIEEQSKRGRSKSERWVKKGKGREEKCVKTREREGKSFNVMKGPMGAARRPCSEDVQEGEGEQRTCGHAVTK